MISRQVYMLLYWGGQIINGEHGWGYNMQNRKGIVLNKKYYLLEISINYLFSYR